MSIFLKGRNLRPLYFCLRDRSAVPLILTLLRSYFQCGVSNFLLGRYELALKDFEDALLYLRGNQAINYEQLGLKFRLYMAEVLFNKGLCLVYLGTPEEGLQDMREAQKEKATEEHNVIDEAIADGGEGYTVFSIVSLPTTCLPAHHIHLARTCTARWDPLPSSRK